MSPVMLPLLYPVLKREQKQGLLKCHKTTIREQKLGLGAGLVVVRAGFEVLGQSGIWTSLNGGL